MLFNEKSIDGRWWRFSRQKGPTCLINAVKIVKDIRYHSNVGVDYLAGSYSLFKNDLNNKGIPALPYADKYSGGHLQYECISILSRQPFPVMARRKFIFGKEGMINFLKSRTPRFPAILAGEIISGPRIGSLHAIVCVGPDLLFNDSIIILDPRWGLQYIEGYGDENNQGSSRDKKIFYKPATPEASEMCLWSWVIEMF